LSTDRVPLQGVATPVELVDDDPDELAALLTPAGMRLTVVGDEPGVGPPGNCCAASWSRGLSVLAIESLRAAEKAGQADWCRDHLTGIDDALIERLVTGAVKHQVRRAQEMEAPAAMLRELGGGTARSEDDPSGHRIR
jgi:hypothetical protein